MYGFLRPLRYLLLYQIRSLWTCAYVRNDDPAISEQKTSNLIPFVEMSGQKGKQVNAGENGKTYKQL